MTLFRIESGDCRDVMLDLILEGVQVDAIVTDPPYHLSTVKRFGKAGAAPARSNGPSGVYGRLSAGFMGHAWDGGDIAFDPEVWELCLKLLKPGGYLLAFSSSRTYHRMACAIEDAGFRTHPMIGWTFASGMPKAHSPKLPEWEGWYYGGQARKPALEPIYVGQKPFSEKNGRENILKHGVGAVNIDGCRVPSEGGKPREGEASQDRVYRDKGATDFGVHPGPRGGDPKGRWPANLITDGSPEVVALFPESKGQIADASTNPNRRANQNVYGPMRSAGTGKARGDSGSAARFFESYPFEDRPIFHYPKASKKDRAGSKHSTVKPIALMRALVRHVTPPGGTVLDPFAGSGTTGQAAVEEGFKTILIEREEQFLADIKRRMESLLEDALA